MPGKRQHIYQQLQSWASMAPLMACILGPLSILLNIPALTQRWRVYVTNDKVIDSIPDPSLNIILSACSLVCEVFANAILMLRFSNIALRITTPLSLVLWIAKVAFCLGNYLEFVAIHPQRGQDWIYSEAFWIGIASMVISGIVIIFLSLNLTIAPVKRHLGIHERAIQEQHRLAHRGFMFRVLILVVSMGFGSLAFSKLEGFSFITGLYLVTASILTVGFGDVVLTTTAGRVILFPYLVFSVTYVALMVSSIANLIDERLDAQKELREHMAHMTKLAKEQKEMVGEELHDSNLFAMPMDEKRPVVTTLPLKRTMTLQEEIEIQTSAAAKLENRRQIRNIFLALLFFLIFWLIGAVAFAYSEGWEYGTSMYFCYVFFMTVGYGDYSPKSQLGRPLFIVYAMIAVPTVTFLVQVFVEAANISKYVYNSKRSRQKRLDELDTRELKEMKTKDSDVIGLKRQLSIATTGDALSRTRTMSRSDTVEAERTITVTQTIRVPTSPRSRAPSIGSPILDEDDDDLAARIVRAEIDIRSRLLQNARKLDHLTRLLISPHLHSEARLLLSLEMGRLDSHYRNLLQILSKSAKSRTGQSDDAQPIEMEDTREAEWLGLTGIERERKFVLEYRECFASLIGDVEELVGDVIPASLESELAELEVQPMSHPELKERHDRNILHKIKRQNERRKARKHEAIEETSIKWA